MMHSIFLILIIALLSVQNIYCVCRAKNIQSMYGVQTDVPFDVFSGLKIAYVQPYLDATTSDVLQGTKSNCSADSIACVGCFLNEQNAVIQIAACGNCKAIFTETPLNTPNLVNGVYWYETPSFSFGFSNSSLIDQNKADYLEAYSDARVSWYIDTYYGGFRCGSNRYLSNDNSWMKIIYTS